MILLLVEGFHSIIVSTLGSDFSPQCIPTLRTVSERWEVPFRNWLCGYVEVEQTSTQ